MNAGLDFLEIQQTSALDANLCQKINAKEIATALKIKYADRHRQESKIVLMCVQQSAVVQMLSVLPKATGLNVSAQKAILEIPTEDV